PIPGYAADPLDLADVVVIRHAARFEPVVAPDRPEEVLPGAGVVRDDRVADLHGAPELEGHAGDAGRGRGLAARVGGLDLLPDQVERGGVGEVAEGAPADRDAVLRLERLDE